MEKRKLLFVLKFILSCGLFSLAGYLLYEMLHRYDVSEISGHVVNLSKTEILIAFALTIVNYFILIFYDYLGVLYTGQKLAFKKIAFAACTSYSISHSLGFSSILGAGIRYRIYSSSGIKVMDIAKIVIMCGISFGLGYISVLGFSLIFEPKITMELTGVKDIYFKFIGVLMLAGIALYITLTKISKGAMKIFGHNFKFPSTKITLLQILSGSLDVFVAASVLYIVMPNNMPGGYLEFVGIYVIGMLIATATHIPGGLGIFESIILLFYSLSVPAPELIAGLLAFRGIYFIVPLIIGSSAFTIFEFAFLKNRLKTILVSNKE